ncbi:M48 family metallopeptidase [Proteiniphilum saccharofermentans]|uniref:M48 family metallopeptidase n=1 Tax=Proteiniphilum saccharofermentans TaxID=1642647 RepID=UPI0028AA4ABE|nr:YgjP-like metallopeptidase domain-containing protein [Proteiniphilum saccharofermentans]
MYEYYDNELGSILIKPNVRAKKLIARRKGGEIYLTVPYGFDFKRLPQILDEMRPRLIKVAVNAKPLITEESVIDTFTFQARISRTDKMKNVQMRLRDGELMVFIPDGLDMMDRQLQDRIKDMVRSVLRHEAKRVLPQKVAFWAKEFNLQFSQVKINKSTTRWGSCSLQKNVNLSLYLMLLPERLIDYVVLHELAHTVEMNHGEKFWELLSKLCGEDARAVSRSVRKFNSPAYNLIKP